MKFMLVAATMILCLQAFAIVADDTMYRSDAAFFDNLINEAVNDAHIVTIYRHDDYGTLNYMVMWGEGSDVLESWLVSVVACSLVSETTSWSSDRVYVLFMEEGNLYSMSTNDCRYMTDQYGRYGADWAMSYIANHMTAH